MYAACNSYHLSCYMGEERLFGSVGVVCVVCGEEGVGRRDRRAGIVA